MPRKLHKMMIDFDAFVSGTTLGKSWVTVRLSSWSSSLLGREEKEEETETRRGKAIDFCVRWSVCYKISYYYPSLPWARHYHCVLHTCLYLLGIHMHCIACKNTSNPSGYFFGSGFTSSGLFRTVWFPPRLPYRPWKNPINICSTMYLGLT